MSSTSSTLLRSEPLVFGVILSRSSQAASIVDCRSAISLSQKTAGKLAARAGKSIAIGGELGQKSGKIVGHMVGMLLARPAMQRIQILGILVVGRGDQHGGHAELMRDFEVAGDILEHRRTPRLDAGLGDEFAIGADGGLGDIVGMNDIEDVAEMMGDADARQHLLGMNNRAIGEYELAAGKRMQCL